MQIQGLWFVQQWNIWADVEERILEKHCTVDSPFDALKLILFSPPLTLWRRPLVNEPEEFISIKFLITPHMANSTSVFACFQENSWTRVGLFGMPTILRVGWTKTNTKLTGHMEVSGEATSCKPTWTRLFKGWEKMKSWEGVWSWAVNLLAKQNKTVQMDSKWSQKCSLATCDERTNPRQNHAKDRTRASKITPKVWKELLFLDSRPIRCQLCLLVVWHFVVLQLRFDWSIGGT